MPLRARLFPIWFVLALLAWAGLFVATGAYAALERTWIYPAVMVPGAFVAGITPEGGGAVAFPVLNVFFGIDRELARDFSLMIQSVGMTSAVIFILTRKDCDLAAYRPVLLMLPPAIAGFILGMVTLQAIPTFIIQALFLALISAFAIAYVFSRRRGSAARLGRLVPRDVAALALVLVAGGMCASLFGTGADIVLYTLLVSRFGLMEKFATHLSIMLMAALSLFGFAWRGLVDRALTGDQFDAWLAAWPVVMVMAPLGVFVLARIDVKWMLRGLIVLNVAQLGYFNLREPSVAKLVASAVFFLALLAVFRVALARVPGNRSPSRA